MKRINRKFQRNVDEGSSVTLIGIGWKSGKSTQVPGPNGGSVAMDGDTPVPNSWIPYGKV
jgi:hypothetical protein